MSYYYKYQFVSPDSLYAKIKEELKSYFDTGAIDDLLFPVWTNKCLQRLGNGSLKIEHVVLNMADFQCKLPPDFSKVREAWLTTSVVPVAHQIPGAYYREITTCLNPDYVPDPNCFTNCNPELVNLTYKTTTQEAEFPLVLKHLLQPGNVNARLHCEANCPNLNVVNNALNQVDAFDIEGDKFRTNFREGIVYLMYYAEKTDEEGYQLIPDNYRIQEFIEAFIKQKIFEQLYNQVVDETFNQIERKYQVYKQMADEAYIIALTETKKETVYDKVKAAFRQQHSLDQFIVNMYGNPRYTLRGPHSGRRRRI
jgi:hypothetical protein